MTLYPTRLALALGLVAVLSVSTVGLTAQEPVRTPTELLAEIDAVMVTATAQVQRLTAEILALLAAPPETPVTTAADLTFAVQKAGHYVLTPGIIKGNFVVSVPGVSLSCATAPPERRVFPADVASCQVVALDRTRPVMIVLASQTILRGITWSGALPTHDTVQVGSNTATTAAVQPTDVTIDQNAILADPAGGHRGLAFHGGANGVITRNYIAGFVEQNRDSQAIWMNNGPGPTLIEDNFLEASGENILVGGDSVRIPGLVPADITVRRNTFSKNPLWRKILNPDGSVQQPGRPGSVKNSFELKCAERVTFEDNLIDGMWVDAQAGNVIVLTPRNPAGDSGWCRVRDVLVQRNRVINQIGGTASLILGVNDNPDPKFATGRTTNITFRGNYFPAAPGMLLINRGIVNLIVENNTAPAVRWSVLKFTGAGDTIKTTLSVQNNVTAAGEYGIAGDGTAVGIPSLEAWAPGYVWLNNVVEPRAGSSLRWPAGTKLLTAGGLAALLDINGHYIPGGAGW